VAVALTLGAAAAPAAAQTDDPEAGRIIGRAIAAGTLLATDDLASGGRYTVDDDADTEFRIRQLGGDHRFERAGRFEPFIGVTIGQVLVDQKIDLGDAGRADSDFEIWGIAVRGGGRFRFASGWFAVVRAQVSYDFAESRLRYPDPETAEILGPLIDGVLFNWQAEAVTLEGGVGLGWEHRTAGGVRTLLQAATTHLRTDPVKTDHPVQDVTTDSRYERLLAAFQIPLGVSISDRPLRLDPRLRHTFLDDELADPLDSNSFTDLRLALLAEWPETSRWPISGLGLAVSYTTADAFEGWSVGVTLGD
jgi:hypothetical protein